MNWDAITAVAQVVAAFGVIASLLYLAMQVRHENRASRVASKLASTRLLTEFIDSFIVDPVLMDLWLKGRNQSATLSETEHYRFANMCLKAFWFSSAAHFQKQMNTLQAEEWIEFHSVILFWLEGEGVRQWWRSTGRYRFGAAFGDFIEAEIASLAAAASTGD